MTRRSLLKSLLAIPVILALPKFSPLAALAPPAIVETERFRCSTGTLVIEHLDGGGFKTHWILSPEFHHARS